MNFQVVLVEHEQDADVTTSSGLMLNEKYVLIIGNLLWNYLQRYTNILEKLEREKIVLEKPIQDIKLNVKHKKENSIVINKANVFGLFLNKNLYNSSKNIFDDWRIDDESNTTDIRLLLSLFFVLKIDGVDGNINEFWTILKVWWEKLTKTGNFNKGDDISSISVPFGNINFFESYSKGIVSNILGLNSCLVLSDIASTPGCEGSPIFKFSSNIPEGVIISTLNWWKGEWLGLTLIADIRPILKQLLGIVSIKNNYLRNGQLLDSIEYSLVKLICGNVFGTGIILSKEKGIILTNSHVLENWPQSQLNILWKEKSGAGQVVYKTPQDSILDLGIVKFPYLKSWNVRNMTRVHQVLKKGDTIYAAGFSVFSKNAKATPTVSKGYISSVDKSMIKTTSLVHGGASGGAILTTKGELAGIIVCNVKLPNGSIYPRVNMAIPETDINPVLTEFLQTDDVQVLRGLETSDVNQVKLWKMLNAKL